MTVEQIIQLAIVISLYVATPIVCLYPMPKKRDSGVKLLAAVRQPLLLAMPVGYYNYADYFIRRLACDFNGVYDFSYLRDYLVVHLNRYPDGKLPAQAATIAYHGDNVEYTLNFCNAQDIRVVKYIKPCIKLLREPKVKKTKQVDVLQQAEQVLKTKRQRKVKAAEVVAVEVS